MTLEQNYNMGKNMTVFARDLTVHARNLLVLKNCDKGSELIPLSNEMLTKLNTQAQNLDNDCLMEYMKIFSSIESEMKYALSPKTLIETAIITAISEVEKGQKKN